MVFQAGYPALSSPILQTEEITSTVCTEVFQVEDWKQVIFSDESKFVMGYGNKGPRVLRQKYERHKAACLKRSVKHLASVMVWGCVSSRGVGSLCFLSPKTIVNTEVYIDLLDAYLLLSVDKLFAYDDFVFQHDLAPPHRSY